MGEGFTTTIGAPSTIEFVVAWFFFTLSAAARALFILDVDRSTVLVIQDKAIFHGKRVVRNERKGRTSHDST
jgi:hypothetical protein